MGRLTQALADSFSTIVGIDIAATMLETARTLHADRPAIRFLRAPADDLSAFPDDSFDVVFCQIVLQHLPSGRAIQDALAEMVRVLRPGGLLVAQTTSHMRLRHRLQPRARLYRLLRAVGVSAPVIYRRLKYSRSA